MKIYQNILNRISVLYLSIPLFIFLIFWLKPIFSLITVSALAGILVLIFNNNAKNSVSKKEDAVKTYSLSDSALDYYEIKKYIFILTIFIAFIWCLLAGLGSIVYQYGPDWNPKNAIMHDLIELSWPVIYDNGSALTYYFGFSLPSALFGKLVSFLGFQHNIAFKAANYFALFWASAGVSLIAFNLYYLINTEKKKLLIFLLFIFFSGLDIFLANKNCFFPPDYIIEWHNLHCYPSHTGQLFFNHLQSISPWLVTLLFVKSYKDITNMGIYSVFTLFYSPLAFLGISFYFIIITSIELFKSIVQKSNAIFKQIFNIKNILSIVFLFTVLFLFFKSNHNADNSRFVIADLSSIIFISKFIFFEVLILILLLINKFKKNIIFRIMTLYLIMIPFCRLLSGESDFYMRASIPSLCILSIFTIKMIMNDSESKFDNICKKLVVIHFIVGALTSIILIYGILYNTYYLNSNEYIQDIAKTFKNKISPENCHWFEDIGDYCNYATTDKNNYPFWKYLASPKRNRDKI